MNTEQTKYKVVNGTFYDEGTPDEVCRVLEHAHEVGPGVEAVHGRDQV
jgi:hypothetical protein